MRAAWRSLRRYLPQALLAFLLVPVLYAVSRANYLLFHATVEILGVVVAFGIFLVAWNTRRTIDNGYLLFLGQAFLLVGALDLLHALAYKGMGVFPGRGANLPTQLWIAARALESLGFLVAPLFLARAVPLRGALLGGALLASGLVAAIFSGRFPDCFVEGQGLTAFKVGSEYAIVLVLGAALALLARRRERFEPRVLGALALALAAKIGAELSFTLYVDVYGFTNVLGHLLKLVSSVLVYEALVVTGISRPCELLFRDLKRHEGALESENLELLTAQEALRRHNTRYAELIAEKNELLGVAAHDIRSPLSVIETYCAYLCDSFGRMGDAERLKLLGIIRRTNRRALDMVDNVLDLSAIESGRLRLDPRPLDLRRLVEENLEAHRVLARSKGTEIDFAVEGDLPPVPADPLRFEQVLSNLVSNALKYSPPGTRIAVRLFRRNGSVGLAVQDQGGGIPREALGKLFQPFSPGAAAGTVGERSTGLGLAIVQKIVASHGGSVEVDSAVGRGSTFTALFPLDAPPGPPGGESGRGERI